MKKIFVLFFFMSHFAYGHDMPDQVKKENIIDILVESVRPLESRRAELEKGKIRFGFAESTIAFTAAPIFWEKAGWFNVGDQDYEEFHLTFKVKEKTFVVSGDVKTEELMGVDNPSHFLYVTKLEYVYLKRKGEFGFPDEYFVSDEVKEERAAQY